MDMLKERGGGRLVWLLLMVAVLVLQPVIIGLAAHRNPEKALAWIFAATLLPGVGLALFYFMERKFRPTGGRTARGDPREPGRAVPPAGAASFPGVLPFGPVRGDSRTEVFTDGERAFQAMLEAMEGARERIDVEFYTIRDDGTGARFQQVWVRKARQGVKVRVLYDGLGSRELSAAYVQKLREAGVDVRCFLPPRKSLWPGRINHRNHRKVAVIDGRTGFLGGLNIGDEYVGKHPRLGYWRDTHLKVEGGAVRDLERTFVRDWTFAGGHEAVWSMEDGQDPGEARTMKVAPATEAGLAMEAAQDMAPSAETAWNGMDAGFPFDEPVQIVASGPDTGEPLILYGFLRLIQAARRSILWTTPYFIPDAAIRLALKTAALSGVDVRILLPLKPDHRVAQLASLSYVKELLQAGVRFFLYRKGFIHAKTLVVDDFASAVGTANLDLRSLYKNYELTAFLYHPRTIRKLREDFARDLKDSEELRPDRLPAGMRRGMRFSAVTRVLSPML